MKKKILLGSIFAVAILIFLSFTNVVGIHTVESNSDGVSSPLFSIRSKRAINGEQNYETCSYIGIGKEIKISIPKRDNKKALIQDFIVRINQMDYVSFKKLVTNVITRLNRGDESNDIDVHRLLLALHLLRTHPDKVQDYIIARNNDYSEAETSSDCTFGGKWFPGCYFYTILGLLIALVGLLYLYISSNLSSYQFYETCQWTCQEPSFCLIGCGIK